MRGLLWLLTALALGLQSSCTRRTPDEGSEEERIQACVAFTRCFKTSGFVSCFANEPGIQSLSYPGEPPAPFPMTAAQTTCLARNTDCIAISECLTGPGLGGKCDRTPSCSRDGSARLRCGPAREGGGYFSGVEGSCAGTGATCTMESGLHSYPYTICAAQPDCVAKSPATCLNDRVIETCHQLISGSGDPMGTIVRREQCGPGQHCRDAGCVDDPPDCSRAPLPSCDGTLLRTCAPDAGSLVVEDCAATSGRICWTSPFGRAAECVTSGSECTSSYRACVGSEARFCDRGHVSALDCRKYGFSGCENNDCVP